MSCSSSASDVPATTAAPAPAAVFAAVDEKRLVDDLTSLASRLRDGAAASFEPFAAATASSSSNIGGGPAARFLLDDRAVQDAFRECLEACRDNASVRSCTLNDCLPEPELELALDKIAGLRRLRRLVVHRNKGVSGLALSKVTSLLRKSRHGLKQLKIGVRLAVREQRHVDEFAAALLQNHASTLTHLSLLILPRSPVDAPTLRMDPVLEACSPTNAPHLKRLRFSFGYAHNPVRQPLLLDPQLLKQLLRRNDELSSLKLENFGLRDCHFVAIAHGLVRNAKLRSLKLYRHPRVTAVGLRALRDVLRDHTDADHDDDNNRNNKPKFGNDTLMHVGITLTDLPFSEWMRTATLSSNNTNNNNSLDTTMHGNNDSNSKSSNDIRDAQKEIQFYALLNRLGRRRILKSTGRLRLEEWTGTVLEAISSAAAGEEEEETNRTTNDNNCDNSLDAVYWMVRNHPTVLESANRLDGDNDDGIGKENTVGVAIERGREDGVSSSSALQENEEEDDDDATVFYDARCCYASSDDSEAVLRRGNANAIFSEKLENIRSSVEAHPIAWPFIKPVSRRHLPYYYEHISHPMDLQTIREKNTRCEYHTADSFIRDFDLMKANAIRFNGEGHVFAKNAGDILEYVRDQVDSIRSELTPLEEQVAEIMSKDYAEDGGTIASKFDSLPFFMDDSDHDSVTLMLKKKKKKNGSAAKGGDDNDRTTTKKKRRARRRYLNNDIGDDEQNSTSDRRRDNSDDTSNHHRHHHRGRRNRNKSSSPLKSKKELVLPDTVVLCAAEELPCGRATRRPSRRPPGTTQSLPLDYELSSLLLLPSHPSSRSTPSSPRRALAA